VSDLNGRKDKAQRELERIIQAIVMDETF